MLPISWVKKREASHRKSRKANWLYFKERQKATQRFKDAILRNAGISVIFGWIKFMLPHALKGAFVEKDAVKSLREDVNSESQTLLRVSRFYSTAAEIRLLFESCYAFCSGEERGRPVQITTTLSRRFKPNAFAHRRWSIVDNYTFHYDDNGTTRHKSVR